MNEEDTLGKGRCKCLFRHEKDEILEGLSMLLQKRKEELEKEKISPIYKSMYNITENTIKRVKNTPLCIEETLD
jgi:hypothetical protein